MTADASTRLDRYIAGELPRDEERNLAQAALDDPDLFDALMAESAARTAIRLEGASDRAAAAVPLMRTRTAAVLAAAAALTLAVLYPLWRASTREIHQPAQTAATPPTPSPAPAAMSVPEILTARLEDLTGASTAAFRSAAVASRGPNAEGIITEVGGGDAAVALGSLDGVVQDAELDVYRGNGFLVAVSRLRIEAVFRETSRARVIGAEVHVGDVVLVPPTLAVAAARQRIVSLLASGEASDARRVAEQALPHLKNPGVHADDKRAVLTMLGALERRAGERDHAVEHLRTAVNLLPIAPMPTARERTETLTEFGAALVDTRSVDEAERAFRDARQTASGVGAVRVLNDLGAAAALRGDRSGAADFYRAALKAAGDAPALAAERRAIAKNLADLAPAR